MDVSIIIVNYHSEDMIIDCVKSIRDKTENLTYEIIIVDNASGEDSITKLHDNLDDSCKIIESKTNLGFGKANNLGFKHSVGKYVFLLNPDTLLINNAIKILYEYMKNNNSIGVVGANLYSPDMIPTSSFCREFDTLEMEKKKSSWKILILDKIHQKAKKTSNLKISEFNYSEKPLEVAYIFGADMLINRNVYEDVGGFDPDFFMYGEEEELTWRIYKRGLKSICIPDAKIIHLEGATTDKLHQFSDRQFKMRMTGTMTYYKKRYGESGVDKFYKYRSSRYKRLCKIGRIRGKNMKTFGPYIMLRLLEETYKDFKK